METGVVNNEAGKVTDFDTKQNQSRSELDIRNGGATVLSLVFFF